MLSFSSKFYPTFPSRQSTFCYKQEASSLPFHVYNDLFIMGVNSKLSIFSNCLCFIMVLHYLIFKLRFGQWEPLKLISVSFGLTPIYFLSTFFISGIATCSRLVLEPLCPSPRTSHLSKNLFFFFFGNDLGIKCLLLFGCFYLMDLSQTKGNIRIYTYRCKYIYLFTYTCVSIYMDICV